MLLPTAYGLLPRLRRGQRLLLQLELVPHLIERGGYRSAVQHEGELMLLGPHQNQQVLHVVWQATRRRLVNPPAQLADGERTSIERALPREVLRPELSHHEVRLGHLA